MDIKEKLLNIIKEKELIQKGIFKEFGKITQEEKKEIRKILKELYKKDIVYKDSKNRYHIKPEHKIVGTIEFTRRGTMAFVTGKNGEEIAVTVENAGNAMHGDRVLIEKIGKWRDLDSGKVVKVLKRGTKTLVGQVQKKKTTCFVIPIESKINSDFYIPKKYEKNAKNGQIVKIKVIKYKTKVKNPEAKIVEILGNENEPKIDLPIVLAKHDLPEPKKFKENVISEAHTIPKKITKTDLKGRKDFRDEVIFTIDGDTAKDFDDAVSIKKLDNENYELGVHIADVSNYVKENRPLDLEAYRRGTSVYLIDTVIPMLPHELSDWICSLVENEERLTMSLIMEINKNGDVVSSKIYNGVIKSKKRLTYKKVNLILNNEADESLEKEIGWLKPQFELMKELMQILRENRKKRGSILDIESGEIYFEFDEKGFVKDIVPVERGISEVIIEEFMIKANEEVASYFFDKGLPFIYRVHANPDPNLLIQLKNYLEIIGVKVDLPKNITSNVLQEILNKTKDHPLSKSIQKLLVRTMKRAVYSDENIGHFGLGSSAYTHFTSPIRRYPDLIVHRMLKKYIKNNYELKKEDIEKYKKVLPEIAEQSSKNERNANEAEWDLYDMKKAEYMQAHLSEEFEVFITGIMKFGFFVEIPEKMINGLVHISELKDDYYNYREKDNMLIGEKTKRVLKVGDKLKVKVVKVNKLKAEIDFIPILEKQSTKPKKNRKNKKSKKRR